VKQNTRACMVHTTTTHVPACIVYLSIQMGWQTRKRRTRYAGVHVGAKHAHTSMTQCKHPGKAPEVSLSQSLGINGHQRNVTLDKGGKWPQRAHCCEQRKRESEPYFSELRGLEKTVVCAYAMPLVAPSARRGPIPRGVAKIVIVTSTPVGKGRRWPAWLPK